MEFLGTGSETPLSRNVQTAVTGTSLHLALSSGPSYACRGNVGILDNDEQKYKRTEPGRVVGGRDGRGVSRSAFNVRRPKNRRQIAMG